MASSVTMATMPSSSIESAHASPAGARPRAPPTGLVVDASPRPWVPSPPIWPEHGTTPRRSDLDEKETAIRSRCHVDIFGWIANIFGWIPDQGRAAGGAWRWAGPPETGCIRPPTSARPAWGQIRQTWLIQPVSAPFGTGGHLFPAEQAPLGVHGTLATMLPSAFLPFRARRYGQSGQQAVHEPAGGRLFRDDRLLD